MSANKRISASRHGEEDLLKFWLSLKMGKKEDLFTVLRLSPYLHHINLWDVVEEEISIMNVHLTNVLNSMSKYL